MGSLDKLLEFLDRLERDEIWYRLGHFRSRSSSDEEVSLDALTVTVDTPGAKWEVEFFDDGHVEVERFFSPGDILDESVLEELFDGTWENPFPKES